ncbi:MAG: T9SS type A sorting domain-containing protein [Saprospiraceae bacterium]|nr:T9SS type A sorting domain-containing protein [Saprospiraceae bacterium]
MEYFSFEPKEINIQIFNISGTLLFSERTQTTFGHNRIQILSNHFGNLPGLYFVKLFTNDESHVVKLIVK